MVYQCSTIQALYAEGSSVLLVFEHDLTMDVPLENGFSHVRHCYHSNIYQERFTCTGHSMKSYKYTMRFITPHRVSSILRDLEYLHWNNQIAVFVYHNHL